MERSLIKTDETLEFACVVKTICDEYNVDPVDLRIFPSADRILSLSNKIRFKKRLVIKIPLPSILAPDKIAKVDPHLRLIRLRAIVPEFSYSTTNEESQIGRLGIGLGEFELRKDDKKIQFWVWNGAQDYYIYGDRSTYFIRKNDVLALTSFIKRTQRLNRRCVEIPILASEMLAEIHKNSIGFLLRGREMKDQYKKYRIPYKRGILLSGPAGCVTGNTKIRIRKKSDERTHKIHDV